MDLPALLEPDDLLTMPEYDHYELIDGIAVEKDMGSKSEKIAFNLSSMLNLYVRMHKLGEVFNSNTGFECFPNRPRMMRKPDAAFIARDRMPADGVPDGWFKVAPDLVVESVSPSEKADDLEKKIKLYWSAGVKLIWILYPATKEAQVRRLNGTVTQIPEDGLLDGEDVIPGFTCRIAELFS